MSESSPAPVSKTVSKQVVPIGLNGSGSITEMGKNLEKQNQELTMQIAQAAADDVYDAKVPPRTSPEKYVNEPFINKDKGVPLAYSIGVLGVLLIVYGLVVE
jgi:hypothetical protein